MSTVSNYYYSPSTITRLLHKAVDTVIHHYRMVHAGIRI